MVTINTALFIAMCALLLVQSVAGILMVYKRKQAQSSLSDARTKVRALTEYAEKLSSIHQGRERDIASMRDLILKLNQQVVELKEKYENPSMN